MSNVLRQKDGPIFYIEFRLEKIVLEIHVVEAVTERSAKPCVESSNRGALIDAGRSKQQNALMKTACGHKLRPHPRFPEGVEQPAFGQGFRSQSSPVFPLAVLLGAASVHSKKGH